MRTSATGTAGTPWSGAVDVHHHTLPAWYARELAGLGYSMTLPGVDAPAWTADTALETMDRQGVRAAVLNVWPGVPAVDPATGARLARRVNEHLAGLVADHPGRFGAFAVLPLPDVDAALAELAYALDELRLDGISLVTHYAGTYVGDPRLDAFHAEAARRGTPLFVHPTAPPATGQPDFGLPLSLCEFPFETVRLCAQLLYHRTLERHPGLRIILSHGGGGLAYYATRLTLGPLVSAGLGPRLPADPIGLLQGLYVDTAMVGDRHAFPAVRAFARPDRMLVGTDFPFMPASYGEDNGRYIVEDGGLGADGLALLQHGNAARLFPRLTGTGDEATGGRSAHAAGDRPHDRPGGRPGDRLDDRPDDRTADQKGDRQRAR
ncbi:amidohydrolase family protein [Streptomyces sp. URMC 126]|uniref:amidohydrolase family protein n=1 Tax=Streptomyces sp. URMC 126 TaxID=3423401 RepID=UPI003F1CECBC